MSDLFPKVSFQTKKLLSREYPLYPVKQAARKEAKPSKIREMFFSITVLSREIFSVMIHSPRCQLYIY